MRILLLLCAVFTVSQAFAQTAGQTSTTMNSATEASTSTDLTEVGMTYSSINKGTTFAGIAIMREWDNGLAAGVRGYMPLTFNKDVSQYMAQGFMRIMILNEQTQIYLEPGITQGYFTSPDGNQLFSTVDASFGATRKINNQFALGGGLGVNWSTDTITNDRIQGKSTFYNRVFATGSYFF